MRSVTVLAAGALLLTSCTHSTDSPSRAAAAVETASPLPAYTILKAKPGAAGNKINIDVLLPQKLTKEELRQVALAIKAKHDGYEKTWIGYYLPGMKVDAGAWATTHFTPELEVVILGATATQEAGAKQAATAVKGQVIGRWYEEQWPWLKVWSKG